jgi:hypothetical protein
MGVMERRRAPALGVAFVAMPLLALTALGLGCSGTIEQTGANGPGGPGPNPGDLDGDGIPDAIDPDVSVPGAGGAGATDGDGVPDAVNPDDGTDDVPGAGGADEAPASGTRLFRLTHAQWERSVRELLQLPESQALPGPLRDDPVQSGFAFDNNAITLVVDEALFSGYERAASELAALVTGDAELLANLVPEDSLPADERADTFIEDFGLRAHRRPLNGEMLDEYRDLFDLAPTLYTGPTDFEAGVRAVIEAMLLSPYFLYRIEESDEEVEGVIPLDAYEIASRLSYTLWGSMPDDALFDAAGSDSLLETDEVETQARRMLADDRARTVVLDFHRQMFDVGRFAGINPAEAFFPDASDTLAESALSEFERFVVDQVIDRKGSYADMLLSTDTFANQDLADIYGLSGTFDDELVPVALDPAERRGILTQVGFLAAHATSADPDPIHRGVFVARRIACTHISAPPANIPPLPAPEEGATNRETIEGHTEDPDTVCATCHATLINPFGFPFEGFDAIGAVRTEDNGQPIDTTASPLIGGEATDVADALELAERLAESDAVHACYLQHLLEYSLGREREDVDDPLIDRLAMQSVQDDAAIEELIVGLVTSRSFLTRSAEELP